MRPVTEKDITAGLGRLGIAGLPICLHSSLRSFGQVDGGAEAVVRAFVEAGTTLLVPSFSFRYVVLPPEGLRPPRNAWDYEHPPTLAAVPAVYASETGEIDRRMGAVPAAVVARPDRCRGAHPLCSFAAVGPRAAEAVAGQTPDDVYAPLRWLTVCDGVVLLAGVGLTSMTLVHHAEHLAGRVLFRRWALDGSGETRMVPVGGCSTGFDGLAPSLAPMCLETTVGTSKWLSYPASGVLDTLVSLIRGKPEVTKCTDPDCLRCQDSIAGGPLL